MKLIKLPGWHYYVDELNHETLKTDNVGKWMFFYKGTEGHKYAEEKCQKAVEQGIVYEAKVSDNILEGVSCYYLNLDDITRHKAVIQYFLDNNMINKTKSGKLYNISFKLDKQTIAGDYGVDFKPILKLDEFVDLNTGKWIR